MFEYKDKKYEINLNMERIKLIETAMGGRSLYGMIATTGGMMSISDLEIIFQFGLKEAGAQKYIGQAAGKAVCDEYIQQNGYRKTFMTVQAEMQASVPFLYRLS